MTLFTFYCHNLNAECLILFELFAEAEDINVHRQVQGRPEGLGGGPGQNFRILQQRPADILYVFCLFKYVGQA